MIGLTGPIGGGKSTALALFGALGAATLSSDRIVHRLYSGGALPLRLAERFGPGVLGPDGAVDRRALAAIVFADDDARRDLEAMTHPEVAEAFAGWVRSSGAAPLLVHEVPLLFEAGLQDRYDRTLVVTADPATRRDRLARRGSGADLEAREGAQLAARAKERLADDVIVNDGTVADLRRAVEAYARSLAG